MDLTYTRQGLFTIFIPETEAGEVAWRVMAEETGNAAVLTIHEKSVLNQLRKAGYTVKKAKPVTKEEIDEILAQL